MICISIIECIDESDHDLPTVTDMKSGMLIIKDFNYFIYSLCLKPHAGSVYVAVAVSVLMLVILCMILL